MIISDEAGCFCCNISSCQWNLQWEIQNRECCWLIHSRINSITRVAHLQQKLPSKTRITRQSNFWQWIGCGRNWYLNISIYIFICVLNHWNDYKAPYLLSTGKCMSSQDKTPQSNNHQSWKGLHSAPLWKGRARLAHRHKLVMAKTQTTESSKYKTLKTVKSMFRVRMTYHQ